MEAPRRGMKLRLINICEPQLHGGAEAMGAGVIYPDANSTKMCGRVSRQEVIEVSETFMWGTHIYFWLKDGRGTPLWNRNWYKVVSTPDVVQMPLQVEAHSHGGSVTFVCMNL